MTFIERLICDYLLDSLNRFQHAQMRAAIQIPNRNFIAKISIID